MLEKRSLSAGLDVTLVRRVTTIVALLVAGISLCAYVVPAVALSHHSGRPVSTTVSHTSTKDSPGPLVAATILYPSGTIDPTEPSGVAPPGAATFTGYTLNYVNDFMGYSLPVGWYVFSGVPGGDPDGQFAASHVVVDGGLLQLKTARDVLYRNKWVTGGVCQCGLARTYGAYFVRSRITGAGPNAAEVLWPSKGWPPEIDFNETGPSASSTSSTVHFGVKNQMIRRHISIDMTLWHTWGVIWTPSSVTYVVDGQEWGRINKPMAIPRRPMTLDFEQRTSCHPVLDCPTQPVAMLVDWVAEYTPG
jgi:hypothetical protein